ncbi:hypothetical protein FRACYDRAFT_255254 [Fragilariopsis cylindrus CCMP1102]|uniref:Uncharacterized protein n=1 Tax=Fragilariopsis cylindrus CCMP1102 TaxID=635003 RepID=A0A1E7EKA3_9STRA|nr:hypothetical protein FRACYDRAFT_255254 [Fragilariopsis cylindrus CCMP1102]|eukprot:OEU06308.1 hypothetical protein FRACYDRAFT_255254 [Fragilariopsis cylindrus CCMP1102]
MTPTNHPTVSGTRGAIYDQNTGLGCSNFVLGRWNLRASKPTPPRDKIPTKKSTKVTPQANGQKFTEEAHFPPSSSSPSSFSSGNESTKNNDKSSYKDNDDVKEPTKKDDDDDSKNSKEDDNERSLRKMAAKINH